MYLVLSTPFGHVVPVGVKQINKHQFRAREPAQPPGPEDALQPKWPAEDRATVHDKPSQIPTAQLLGPHRSVVAAAQW